VVTDDEGLVHRVEVDRFLPQPLRDALFRTPPPRP